MRPAFFYESSICPFGKSHLGCLFNPHSAIRNPQFELIYSIEKIEQVG